MLAQVRSYTLSGIEAICVTVEVQVQQGKPSFTIVGLGDSAVQESCDRVIPAIRHSGFWAPPRVLVNLAPAELRKEGSALDLPIAVGILAASGQLDRGGLAGRSFHGELSLDGSIQPIRGAVSFALEAARQKVTEVLLPAGNLFEARLISQVCSTPVRSLPEVVNYLRGGQRPADPPPQPCCRRPAEIQALSLSEVWGQASAKRALAVAAAGGHNLLMIGPPGCGKSMLAERFSLLLAPLSEAEQLEVVKIHSLCGGALGPLLSGQRPFRAPHHVISDVGLVGGGSSPHPGEISLAHRGVLFLDEFPEFKRSTLEALRAPLERGEVQVTRAKSSVVFPARFQLLAAMNPCPCGRLGLRTPRGEAACLCTPALLAGYLRRLSQPILDRIDMHIELDPVPVRMMLTPGGETDGEGEALRGRVLEARRRQLQGAGKLNAQLSGSELGKRVKLDSGGTDLLEQAAQRLGLSARTFVRILRVATTIADLDGRHTVARAEVSEALGYRGLDRLQRFANQ